MKLALNTYNLLGDKTWEEIIDICHGCGAAGIEFSIGYGHKHGVELDTPDDQLAKIREGIAAAGLEVASIASYCRFDRDSEEDFQRNLADAKRGIDLAARMGSTIFRFVANDVPDFMPRPDFVLRISQVMRELAEYGESKGVLALLNMHGSFQHRCDVSRAARLAAHPYAGLVYNCAPCDLVGGSVEVTVERVLPYVRHVHLHELTDGYPYPEMFRLLKAAGYKGWFSVAVDDTSAEVQRFLGYYCALVRAWWEAAGQ